MISGQISEDVMLACEEQIGVTEIDAEAGASKAVQMIRALKNNNLMAVSQVLLRTTLAVALFGLCVAHSFKKVPN